MNNFYNEAAPVKTLLSLGTSIPMPALAQCMRAVLAVRLGNYYGRAYSAQEDALRLLRGLSTRQWEYYLNDCLASDRLILEKLVNNAKTSVAFWSELVREFSLATLDVSAPFAKDLVQGGQAGNSIHVQNSARGALAAIGYSA